MSRKLNTIEQAQLRAMIARTSVLTVAAKIQDMAGKQPGACPSCRDTENQLDYGAASEPRHECNHCGMRY